MTEVKPKGVSRDEIVRGARAAYEFLANEFGETFTNIHKRKTFQNKCCSNEVEYWYQESEKKPKFYLKKDLIKWFTERFWNGAP